ncbi:MAG TPA: PilW family protein [Pseudomonadales bacterium]|nr:PilW family protein [Pseudomonadales bacterium]
MKNKQQGLSLVELMIAMTLAVVLTAAVVNIFISSKSTYSVLNGQATMQENGRFAVDFIRQELQKAGYRTYSYQMDGNKQRIYDQNNQLLVRAPDSGNVAPRDTFPAAGSFGAGKVVVGGANTAANAMPNSDYLAVRYQRADDGTMYDCLGAVIPRRADNQIRIVTTRFFVSPESELMCQVSFDNDAPQAPVALVSGVDNLKVRFGVGKNGNVTAYTATPSTADEIYAVEFALLASSDLQTTNNPVTTPFKLLDADVTAPDDKKIRQVFSQTVKLRNVPSFAINSYQLASGVGP